MAGTVMTVTGPIDPASVGPALMHEHILQDLSSMVPVPTDPAALRLYQLPLTLEHLAEIKWSRAGMLSRANIDLSDADEAAHELADFASAGGRTVVEASPIGMRGDIRLLPAIAARSGVHIVVGSAFFVEPFLPSFVARASVDDLAAVLIGEFEEGINETGIRPGVLAEIGTSAPLAPNEVKSLRASVAAARATGMAMVIHLDPWAKEGLRVVDALEEAGADCARVVVGHLNPSLPDLDYHRAMAERGVVLGYDLCGYELVSTDGRFPPRDWETADAVARLVQEGFGRQIILSRDTALKTDYIKYGGWGYGHILRHVVPLLRERHVSEMDIAMITSGTPQRLLTLSR